MNKQTLKENIKARLEALTGWTAYDNNVPLNDADMPYLVYRIGHGDSLFRNRIDRNLEVEFWIDLNDNTLLDEKSDIVRKGKYSGDTLLEPGLDYSYADEGTNGFYNCFHDWEDYIDTGEINITMFMQRYVLHVFL